MELIGRYRTLHPNTKECIFYIAPQGTQLKIHTHIDTWCLRKKPEIHSGKKTTSSTNGAGQIGGQHVEDSE